MAVGFSYISSWSSLLYGAAIANIAWNAVWALYNVFFHPLRRFPGPLLNRASKFPYALSIFRGTLAQDMRRLHQIYGDVVRTGPDELSFTNPQAWKDIYQRPVRCESDELPKNDVFGKLPIDVPAGIFTAKKEEHAALRKAMAPSFSDKAMRDQEPLINQYVDLLIRQLRNHSIDARGQAQPLDVVGWYNWTTFDIIGELAFAESFNCLETASWHTWVKSLLASVKQVTFLTMLHYLGFGSLSILALLPIMKGQGAHLEITKAKLKKRLELGASRNDLLEGLITRGQKVVTRKHLADEKEGSESPSYQHLDMGMLETNSSSLFVAGSETTATLLSGTTFLLLSNRKVLARVVEEVRSAFQTEEEITMSSVSRLPYLLACLNEAMRCYPAVPNAMHRIVPKGGCAIAGDYVPEGTDVTIYQFAQNYSESLWHDPYKFQPERFLKDRESSADRLDALQPFHVGPRDCIGRTLAYTEMKIILARILFNFDMTLAEENPDWIATQKVFTFWMKTPLHVYFKSRFPVN